MKDFNPLQAIVDSMSRRMQAERSANQMTLGALIDRLAALPEDAMVDGIASPHSYRGYYSDIAFEPAECRIPARDALAMCRAAMGEVFTGYKGGEFQMGRTTPVWLAVYGSCGRKIMGVRDDGTLEVADDD